MLLRKGTFVIIAPLRPCCPSVKMAGAILRLFHRSPASLKLPRMLACKGTCAPVSTPFKGQGGSDPIPASLGTTLDYLQRHEELATVLQSNFKSFADVIYYSL